MYELYLWKPTNRCFQGADFHLHTSFIFLTIFVVPTPIESTPLNWSVLHTSTEDLAGPLINSSIAKKEGIMLKRVEKKILEMRSASLNILCPLEILFYDS